MANHEDIKKTIYTLDIGDYEPRIKELTFPLLRAYADKIGAGFEVITKRKRPEWPVTIEKFQVAEMAKVNGDDWSLFIDADTLINPEMFDPTEHMGMDTVAHNGKDMAGVRWSYDKYFRRDGRHIGSCTWFVIGSSWTIEDLWRLPEDSPEDTFKNIHITINEHNSGQCRTEHLIDDYTLSRNIARFGLKFTTLIDICGARGWAEPNNNKPFNPFLYHLYAIDPTEKVKRLLSMVCTPQGQIIPHPSNPTMQPGGHPPIGAGWGLYDMSYAQDFVRRWKL